MHLFSSIKSIILDIAEEMHLPGFPIPEDWPKYLSRKQYAQYLELYKSFHKINTKTQHLVEEVTQDDTGIWTVKVLNMKTNQILVYKSFHLVMATSIYNHPIEPQFKGQEDFKGPILHSSRYTNAKDLGLSDGKRVLVVGSGILFTIFFIFPICSYYYLTKKREFWDGNLPRCRREWIKVHVANA